MKYPDENIRGIGDLIQQFTKHLDGYNGPIWFRGQAVSEWKLEPTLMRLNPQPPETHLLNRFKQNASLLIQDPPTGEFGWLFLMQHYRVPTRLLDWSESPLVALYFAVDSYYDKPGALWALMPTKLNEKSNFRPEYEHEVPSFEDVHLQNYLPATIAHEHKSKLFPMAAIAPRNSPRMQAQQGVFTISHRENVLIEDIGAQGAERDYIWRYIIPPEAKEEVQRQLRMLGYNKFMLFPELESLSDRASQKSFSGAHCSLTST